MFKNNRQQIFASLLNWSPKISQILPLTKIDWIYEFVFLLDFCRIWKVKVSKSMNTYSE